MVIIRKSLLTGLIMAQLWLIILASAECLNSTQVDTINQLANATNISNISLINIFNNSCNYYLSVNNTLYNKTSELNTSITTLNSTLFEELEKLEARLKMHFLDNVTAIVNNTYTNESLKLYNNFTSDTQNILNNFTLKFQGLLETKTNLIWEQMATKQDVNATKDVLRTEMSNINKQNELTFGNNLFWAGIIFLAGIGLFIYFKFLKPTYPKVQTRLIPKALRITPYELDEEKELTVKSDIDTMRKFILAQTDYKGATRAEVYKKFLNGQIETQEQALEEMKMLEPEKMEKGVKAGKKHTKKL